MLSGQHTVARMQSGNQLRFLSNRNRRNRRPRSTFNLERLDNWGIEIYPNPDKQIRLPVHAIALVVNGIFLLENMELAALAKDKAYEFAFIVEPLKIKGGTGSTVAPIAVR